ncbi:hypothetical protein DFJ74DRAFT_644211 [Hyaloraphidium curvatum]|nr:hypothetical protein DFJ74DRAFT_644211 [Hyaloraphidium curvatum]
MFGLASRRATGLAVRGSLDRRVSAQATLVALEHRLVRGERIGRAELRGGLFGALVALRAAEAEAAGLRAGMEQARARADLAAALANRALDEAHAWAEEAHAWADGAALPNSVYRYADEDRRVPKVTSAEGVSTAGREGAPIDRLTVKLVPAPAPMQSTHVMIGHC